MKYKYDLWGNLLIFIPIGLPQTMHPNDRPSYTVTKSQIHDEQSLATLAGTPVTVSHPGFAGSVTHVVSPQTPFTTVGVVLGGSENIRSRPDGGIDVRVKITDKCTIDRILAEELVEISPGYYLDKNNTRIYNHFALLPSNLAVGGAQMRLMIESHPTTFTNHQTMTPEQLQELALLISKYLEEDLMTVESNEKAIEDRIEKAKAEAMEQAKTQAIRAITIESLGFTKESDEENVRDILAKAFPNTHSLEQAKDLSIESLNPLFDAAIGVLKAQAVPPAIEKTEDTKKSQKRVSVTVESHEADEDAPKGILNRYASKR